MDIKQANASETNTGFWTTGCGSVCIQSCHQIPNGCISNKLDIPKSMPLPTFCSYRESVSQSNEGQVYIDHNNTSVAFPTMYTQLLRMSIQDPNSIPPFPNLLTDPNQNQHQLCQNQTLALAAWKVSGNSIL